MTHEPDSQPHAAALSPGDTLGPYTVVSLLGAGQSSVLWRAQDASGKDVVIRQLIPGSPAARERAFLQRCQREVDKHRAVAGDIRRVVLINELSDDPRGAFIVSDFISGASVAQLLDSRPDPFDLIRGLRIIQATAKVLEQIHRHDLIHGGLRPSHIILRLSGGVQVCDVGVAGLIADQEGLDPGAARYMAPELFHGNAADATSDIYALGMVAYEMLAGRGAFEQVFAAILADPRNAAMRWMKWHTNAKVSPTPLHEINPRVPVRLSDLVARMIAKDRSKRIATAEQLLQAIQRHFGKKNIEQAEVSPDAFTPSGPQAVTTGPGDTAELPPQSKTPKIIAIAAAIVVVLTAGIWITVSTIQSQQLAQQRDLATATLSKADQDYNAGRFDDARQAYLAQMDAWPDDNDPLRLHARAGALLALSQIDLSNGDYDKALVSLHELDRLGEAGPADRQAVKSLTDQAEHRQAFDLALGSIREHLDAKRFAQARALIHDTQRTGLTEQEDKQLLELQVQIESQLNTQHIDEALAQADKHVADGDYSAAINHLKGFARRVQSPRIDDRLKSLNTEKQFNELVAKGNDAEQDDQPAQAVDYFEQALALMDAPEISAQVPILKSRAAVQRGRDLAEADDTAAASEAFTTALGYDPDNAEARGWLARMNVTIEKRSLVESARRAEAVGDLVQAAGHYRSALTHGQDDQLLGDLHRVEAGIALAQAEQFIASGQLEQAGTELAKAKKLAPDNPAIDEVITRHDQHTRFQELLTRGDGFVEQGRFAQATHAYRQARDIIDNELINQRLDDTEFNHLLAQARSYIDNEQWASASGILDTAAKLRITDELTRLRLQVRAELDASKGGDDEQS